MEVESTMIKDEAVVPQPLTEKKKKSLVLRWSCMIRFVHLAVPTAELCTHRIFSRDPKTLMYAVFRKWCVRAGRCWEPRGTSHAASWACISGLYVR